MIATAIAQHHTITPDFIDFTTSSFDAILHPNQIADPLQEQQTHVKGKLRADHLPHLLPFVRLITEKCNISSLVIVIALIYVKRFRATLPTGYKTESNTAHRIFVSSILVASKYIDDDPVTIGQIVHASGDVWSRKETARMELAFMKFLRWNLFVSEQEITSFLNEHRFAVELVMPPSC
ncbi:hypothetical protein BGW37DRAFT_473948 [Umbelopsis sp. PMI_123]|nr:hypothetical protein BGW37DRAFT_473948 [Umbelopsis sp. PMI_123]